MSRGKRAERAAVRSVVLAGNVVLPRFLFARAEEWWLEAEVNHPMARLSLVVVFPAERKARRAWVVAQQGQQQVELPVNRWRGDGRQELRYRVARPPLGERYTLKWEW